jgi:hypothetical protein
MASQAPRRERASSDRAQPGLIPQRPGLQSRTISAPPGGLYKLDTSRTAREGGSGLGRTLIEEEENPAHQGGGITVPAAQSGNNEVQLLFLNAMGIFKTCRSPFCPVFRLHPDRVFRMSVSPSLVETK